MLAGYESTSYTALLHYSSCNRQKTPPGSGRRARGAKTASPDVQLHLHVRGAAGSPAWSRRAFPYRLRLPAFVLVDVCHVESVDHHVEGRLPLYKRPEALQLLDRRKADRDRLKNEISGHSFRYITRQKSNNRRLPQ